MLPRMNSGTLHLVLIAGALAASPALGQSSVTTRADKALKDQPATGSTSTVTKSSSRMSMSRTEGGDTYEVTVADGEASAKINGEAVPKGRIRRSDEAVELLDKDGDVLMRFDTRVGVPGGVGGSWAVPAGAGGWRAGPGGNVTFFAPGTGAFGGVIEMEPPKVMFGVTMLEPSEALCEQLELEPGTGVLLERIVEGLPADKAGLKKGDVLVSFDGRKPVTIEKVREILSEKKDGDTVKVVVLRKGEESALTVQLQKYDAQRFDIPGAVTSASKGAGAAQAEALAAAQGAMRKGQAQAHKEMQEALRIYRNQLGAGGGKNYIFGPGQDRLEMFAAPGGAAGAGGEMRERLSSLDKKLAELDEKVSRLDQQLDRLEQKLDRLNRGRE
ncbi:MAG: PDZ domain-containing protein [Phycisphaerales bacterium]